MSKKIRENVEMRDFIIRELKTLMNNNPEYTFCEVIYSVLRMIPEAERPQLKGLVSVPNELFYSSIQKAVEEEKEIEIKQV